MVVSLGLGFGIKGGGQKEEPKREKTYILVDNQLIRRGEKIKKRVTTSWKKKERKKEKQMLDN